MARSARNRARAQRAKRHRKVVRQNQIAIGKRARGGGTIGVIYPGGGRVQYAGRARKWLP
ncbi:MAG: hypothetical protein F4Z31_22775 [Gemmatimonadetes bacterium]|nr:hypothetical protein [Gemmatimonadota bacterium]